MAQEDFRDRMYSQETYLAYREGILLPVGNEDRTWGSEWSYEDKELSGTRICDSGYRTLGLHKAIPLDERGGLEEPLDQ